MYIPLSLLYFVFSKEDFFDIMTIIRCKRFRVPKFEKYSEEVYVSACGNLGVDPLLLRQELDDIKVQDLYTAIGTRPSNEPLSPEESIKHAELGIFCHLVDDIADNVTDPQLVLRVGDLISSSQLHDAENIPFVISQIIDMFSEEWKIRTGSTKELTAIYDQYIEEASLKGEVNKFAFEYSLLKMVLAGFVQKSSIVSLDGMNINGNLLEESIPMFFRCQYRTFLESGIRYGLPESCYSGLRNSFSRDLNDVPDAVLISNASGIQGMFYSMFNPNMTRNDFTIIEIFDALMGPMAYFMNALDESKDVKMPDGVSILNVDQINRGFSTYFTMIKNTLSCLFRNDPPRDRTYLTKLNQFNLGFLYIFLKDSKSPLHIKKFLNVFDSLQHRRYSLPSDYISMATFLNLDF